MNQTTPNEKILERVKRLLAMANDVSSPNEASIAAARARSLMDQYQIHEETISLTQEQQFDEVSSGSCNKYIQRWISLLSVAVSKLNDCQAVIRRSPLGSDIVYRGFKSDTQMAKLLHEFLVDSCEKFLKQSEIKSATERNYYRIGFACEMQAKVEEILKERQTVVYSSGTSLILQKKKAIENHYGASRTRSHRISVNKAQDKAYSRGASDARSLSLNQQIS